MTRTLATKTLLALTATLACAATAAVGARADTGGVASPPTVPNAAKSHGHGVAIATWFGPGFYGQQTACGQTMTPEIVGVANRTLPCGTLVQVGYKGHHLTVPVLDRGPFGHNGANWDLTAGAAQALQIQDTVRVHTHIVGHVTNTPMLGVPPGSSQPGASLTGGMTAG